MGSLLSLDMDEKFDRNVTTKLVARRGNPIETTVPGFAFLEIDGLSEKLFRKALAEGYMPTLKRWIDRGTPHHHRLGNRLLFANRLDAARDFVGQQ